MNITRFSDYSLRVLIYLAARRGEKATAQQIATSYGISFHHLAKAAQWLAANDYIQSERGRGGGISLARPAEDINIGVLLRASEADTVLVDCMRGSGGNCCITPACGLKGALAKAQDAFYAVLTGYSLADVTRQQSALSELLQLR